MEMIITASLALIVAMILWFWLQRSRRQRRTIFEQWSSPTFVSAGGQGAVLRVESDQGEVYALKVSIRKLERDGLIFNWLRVVVKKWKTRGIFREWLKASVKTTKTQEGLILNFFKQRNPKNIVKCIDWGIERMTLRQVINLYTDRWGKLKNMRQPEEVFRKAYPIGKDNNIFPSWDVFVHLEWQLMEMCQKSLNDYIKAGQRIPLPEKVDILHQCANGLVFLHQKCCVHCDIKPDNILFDGVSAEWKICDFGLSAKRPAHEKRLNEGSAVPLTTLSALPPVGTELFMAPEVWKATARSNQPSPANSKVDVYSLGMTFIKMLCPDDNEFHMIAIQVRNGSYDLNKLLPKVIYRQVIIDLLTLMTHPDPTKRLSSEATLAKIEELGPQTEPIGFIYCMGSNKTQFYDWRISDWKSEPWGQPFNDCAPPGAFTVSQGKLYTVNCYDSNQVSEMLQIEHTCCAGSVRIWQQVSLESIENPQMSLDAVVSYENFIYVLCNKAKCFKRFNCVTKFWETLDVPLFPPENQAWLPYASLVAFDGGIYANDMMGFYAWYVIDDNKWYTTISPPRNKDGRLQRGVIKAPLIDSTQNLPSRSWPGITVYRDFIYVFGGQINAANKEVLSSCVRYFVGDKNYELKDNRCWEILADMPCGRCKPSIVIFDEKIFIVGGLDRKGCPITAVDIYDPLINRWYTADNIEQTDWPAIAVVLE